MPETITTVTPVKQPKNVTYAIGLLIAAPIVGLLTNLAIKIFTPDEFIFTSPIVKLYVFGFFIILLLVYFLNKGNRIVQIIYGVLFCLSFYSHITGVISCFRINPVAGVLSVIEFTLNSTAIVLLFSKQSNEWFKMKK